MLVEDFVDSHNLGSSVGQRNHPDTGLDSTVASWEGALEMPTFEGDNARKWQEYHRLMVNVGRDCHSIARIPSDALQARSEMRCLLI